MENTKTKEIQILNKIGRVQSELKAPKNMFNSFGNYAYRSAESILEAVKPLLAKEGLILTLTDDIECIGGRIYVKATTMIKDCDTGEWEQVSAYARESETKKGMDDSQITGTASSYARKYALNGMFLIDDTKDADTDEYAVVSGRNKAQSKTPQTPQIELDAYLREVSELYDATAVKEWWKHASPDIPNDIKQEIYQACKNRLNELTNK